MTSMDEDPGVKLECTCGACPEQYEGTVDGNPAYFRLRHSHWTFTIVKPGASPYGRASQEEILYYKDGHESGQDVGIMEDARGLIMSMVKEFRKSLVTLDEEELSYWFMAIVDAQTEYETIPAEDRLEEPGVDGPDEYWGFFSEWRNMIRDECFNAAFPQGYFPGEKAEQG